MKNLFLLLSFLFFVNVTSQTTVVKKIIKESGEYVATKSFYEIGRKTSKELIEDYSLILVKNGFGKKTRIGNNSTKLFLEETYQVRGREGLIEVGEKISTLSATNLNNIKGFMAEEMHHNALLKLEGVRNIKSGVKNQTSDFVQKKQEIFINNNLIKNSNLYIHKNIELDILADIGNSKFIIEVKNIDSEFNEHKFLEYYSQIVKQKAFADENGIDKLFWSNIGKAKLTPTQKELFEELGVIVVQSGKDNPRINAYLNMSLIKLQLQKLK